MSTAAALQKLVTDFQPLLESLVAPRGQDFHYAAIWGQVPQESRADAAAEEFPGQPTKGGKGLWQHTGPRLKNAIEAPGNPLGLYEFARRAGKPWQDRETQVRFVAYEIANLPAAQHAWHQTLKATTPEAAAGTFMAYFEAPKDWQIELKHPGSTSANLPNRIAGTKAALLAIQSLNKGAKTMTDNNSGGTSVTPIAPNTEAIARALTQLLQRVEDLAQAQAVSRGIPSPIVGLVLSGVNALGVPQWIASQLANVDIDHFVDTQVPALLRKFNVPAPFVAIVEAALEHFDLTPLIGQAVKSVDWESFLSKGFASLGAAHGVTLDLKAN